MGDFNRLLKLTINSKKFWKAVLTILIAFIVYLVLPPECPEAAKRTAFVFVIAGFFWALEIIPLYATSLVVVLSLIFLIGMPDGPLNLGKAGYKSFLIPFASPVIMLFFGGFVLAAALHKYNIDRVLAKKLLGVFGNNPMMIVIGFMLVTAFLSMWMSNTATTAMMLVMITPLLAQLATDDPLKKALVLAIPFGANIGGVGTPVGTPPNAIAIGILSDNGYNIDFLDWMLMAVPLVIVMLIVACVVLFVFFKPKEKKIDLNLEIKATLGLKAKGVIAISLITILLWLTSGYNGIPESITALFSAGCFFSLGLLGKEDIKSIDWDILVLMWGGLALGQGMEKSGLSEYIVNLPIFANEGFLLIVLFCLLGWALASFMSHTAAANLIIPIVILVPQGNPIFLAIAVTLCTSFAMSLPISTPPNAMAFSKGAIDTMDMLKTGTIISAIAVALIILFIQPLIQTIFG